jgi:hypothetical protein
MIGQLTTTVSQLRSEVRMLREKSDPPTDARKQSQVEVDTSAYHRALTQMDSIAEKK